MSNDICARTTGEREPTLSILIPTKDGSPHRPNEFESLRFLLDDLGADYEVIVLAGSSGGAETTARKSPPNVRFMRTTEILETVEETLCAGLTFCKGRYVWFLSDGSGPQRAGVETLFNIIQEDQKDIIIFNGRVGRDECSEGGGAYIAERSHQYFFSGESNCNISDFIVQVGFFSWPDDSHNFVIRRDVANVEAFRKYLDISRVGAHVAWLIEVGKGRRFLFVNRPLAVRSGPPSGGLEAAHWRNVGVREGAYTWSVWTGLWLKILDELVACDALTVRQIAATAAFDRVSRSHWGSDLAGQILEQFESQVEPVPKADVDRCSRWLAWIFPEASALHALMQDISEFTDKHSGALIRVQQNSGNPELVRRIAGELRSRARWWRHAFANTPWYSHYYVETSKLYDIYNFEVNWVAVHTSFGGLREALDIIDLPTIPPVFLRAQSYRDIQVIIDDQRVDIDQFVRVRRSLLPKPDEWTRLSPERDAIELNAPFVVNSPTPSPSGDVVSALKSEIVRQDLALSNLEGSLSWRLTAPLRLAAAAAGLRSRVAPCSQPSSDLGIGEVLRFADASADAFCFLGFSDPEDWGRWTEGHLAVIRLRHATRRAKARLEVLPFMVWNSHGRPCVVKVSINGRRSRRWIAEGGRAGVFDVGASDMAFPEMELRFRILTPKQADEDPLGERRRLGVGVAQLRLEWAA